MDNPIVKQDAKFLKIKEHILYNDASGLTIDFVVNEDTPDCPFRIRIYGNILPYGNREITIDKDGIINGGGTALTDCPFPFDRED